jgi:fructokinase
LVSDAGPPLDVLAFGETIVDFFPDRRGDRIRDSVRFRRELGGAPANVTVGLARLGVRAGLMTLVGADDFGAYLRAALAAEGVDVRGVGTHPTARTGITFVTVGHLGERSFLFYRHPSADQLVAEGDVDIDLIAGARVFHYGSSTLAREPSRSATWKALVAARAAGRVISSDPNLRMHIWADPGEARPLIQKALAMTDLVKVSEDELEGICGTSDIEDGTRRLRDLGVGLAVVTLGARGCFFASGGGGTGMVSGPVLEAGQIVDTTGAGDAFVAGLLAELGPDFAAGARPASLGRDRIVAACELANRVAARSVQGEGGTANLPRRNEV